VTKPPAIYSAAPGASLKIVAMRPPVHDSAVTTLRLAFFCVLEGFYSQLNKLAIDLNEVQFVCGDTRCGASLHRINLPSSWRWISVVAVSPFSFEKEILPLNKDLRVATALAIGMS
jgi:hypothetical protein